MEEVVDENMTVEEVASKMGKSPNWVRLGLQQGRLRFGSAVQNVKTGTWSYHISRAGFWLYQYGYVPENLKKAV